MHLMFDGIFIELKKNILRYLRCYSTHGEGEREKNIYVHMISNMILNYG